MKEKLKITFSYGRPSTFPPQTAKKIVDSKSNWCSTLVQPVPTYIVEPSLKMLNSDNLILLLEVKRKQKPTLAIFYRWLDILLYPSALIRMESNSSNYEYELQKHRLQNYSGWNFADNTFRNYISNHRQKNSKKRQTLSVAETCVQQNLMLLCQRYILSEHLNRFILMPKTPMFGNFCRKTNRKTSKQEPPLFLIHTQSNQDQILLLYYALTSKHNCPSWWKTTQTII